MNPVYDQATALHRKGRTVEALALLDDALRGGPAAVFLVLKARLLLAVDRLAEALAASEQAVVAAPGMAETLMVRGDVLSAMQRNAEAIANYDNAIALNPNLAEIFYNRGTVLQGLERNEEAVQSYDRAIALNPHYFQAWHNRGLALMALSQASQALESLKRSLGINPRQVEAWFYLGNIFSEQSRLLEAVKSYDHAIALAPNVAIAWFNRGNALQRLEQFEAALASYNKVIATAPGSSEVYNNRGNSLLGLGRADEALADFDRAISLAPDYASAYSNRANALRALRQPEMAVASADKAIFIEPDFAEAYSNRGVALLECNRFDDAVVAFDKAISLNPSLAEAYRDRSAALYSLGQIDEAIAGLDKAISLKPDDLNAYWKKSHLLLAIGNYEEGWALYEKGRPPGVAGARHVSGRPRWLGRESLADKTILLHSEQGLGDTIQFCRYAACVAALGGRVILEVQKPLLGLLSGLEGVAQILESGSALPPFDYYCPLLSLPLAFKTDLHTVPTPRPYLRSEPDRLRAWQDRFGEKKKLRIGLAWSGNIENKTDPNRSVALSRLLPYLAGDHEYFCMQKDVRHADQLALRSHGGILSFDSEITDFRDTAALCELMDVIICVDTSIAHLAAALGKPTCLMLSHISDWRWMLGRTDSPWYPSMRLYRQPALDDWENVIGRIMRDLRQGVSA